MSRAEKRLFTWALCLTVGVLTFSQLKFLAPWVAYQKYKTSFNLFSVQLEAMLREIEQEEPWSEGTSDPYIQLYLRDGKIASLTVRKQPQNPENYSSLAETVPTLWEAGVSYIEVYDFLFGSGDRQTDSPCEIWYSVQKEDLVYSANGSLTYSHDPGNPEWGGYRFYQKRLNKNWFIMVSRYDKDNPYWRM